MTDSNGFTQSEKMLDPTSLVGMLRISERHLTDLRREDETFPAPRMLGTLPRWSPATIRRWMDQPVAVRTQRTEVLPEPAPADKRGSNKRKVSARVH